jgi:hypothetical protein
MTLIIPIGGAMEAAETMTWYDVAQRALAALTASESQEGALYLDETEIGAGASVKIDGKDVAVHRRSAMAFVDRMPQSNWGHACRYMLIDLESGQVSSYDAQFPPFLRGVPKTLHLIHRGASVPDWAIATP